MLPFEFNSFLLFTFSLGLVEVLFSLLLVVGISAVFDDLFEHFFLRLYDSLFFSSKTSIDLNFPSVHIV